MAGVLTHQGAYDDLYTWLINHPESPLVLHLYVNAYTPVFSSDISDFVDCSLPGYSPVMLSPASWTLTDTGSLVSITYPIVTFVFTGGGQSIYGYYVEWSAPSWVLWAEEAAGGPFVIGGGGDSLRVQLQLHAPPP